MSPAGSSLPNRRSPAVGAIAFCVATLSAAVIAVAPSTAHAAKCSATDLTWTAPSDLTWAAPTDLTWAAAAARASGATAPNGPNHGQPNQVSCLRSPDRVNQV
ncbi:MAG: hypothetical protein V7607_2572 [Solirubrobacteraceae bacterium]